MRTVALSAKIPPLQPGERVVLRVGAPTAFRGERLVVKMEAERPDIRFYQKRVGGSKRKGQRASWLWAAECLGHRPDIARLTLDNLHVGPVGQMAGGPVPMEIFRPEYPGMTIYLDACRPGTWITMHVTNREFSRVAGGTMVLFGVGA